MGTREVRRGPTAERVAANVRRERRARDWTLHDLADALKNVGRPIVASGIGKIELGERRVDVDDLVALALAFQISPNRLLLRDPRAPHVGDWLELTPERTLRVVEAFDWAYDRSGADREQHARELLEQLLLERDSERAGESDAG